MKPIKFFTVIFALVLLAVLALGVPAYAQETPTPEEEEGPRISLVPPLVTRLLLS